MGYTKGRLCFMRLRHLAENTQCSITSLVEHVKQIALEKEVRVFSFFCLQTPYCNLLASAMQNYLRTGIGLEKLLRLCFCLLDKQRQIVT